MFSFHEFSMSCILTFNYLRVNKHIHRQRNEHFFWRHYYLPFNVYIIFSSWIANYFSEILKEKNEPAGVIFLEKLIFKLKSTLYFLTVKAFHLIIVLYYMHHTLIFQVKIVTLMWKIVLVPVTLRIPQGQ